MRTVLVAKEVSGHAPWEHAYTGRCSPAQMLPLRPVLTGTGQDPEKMPSPGYAASPELAKLWVYELCLDVQRPPL